MEDLDDLDGIDRSFQSVCANSIKDDFTKKDNRILGDNEDREETEQEVMSTGSSEEAEWASDATDENEQLVSFPL